MDSEIEAIAWKSSFDSKGVSPEDAYETIEQVRKRSGGNFTVDDLLNVASNKHSILHPLFEWDDTKAAEAYRRSQAGAMLRSFQVIYKSRPREPLRAFEIVRKKTRGSNQPRSAYSTREEAMKDPVARERLIEEAFRELRAWRKRYHQLSELGPVVQEVDRHLAMQ